MAKGKNTVYLCGVPKEQCEGGIAKLSHALDGRHKTHGTRQQAYDCMKHHLQKKGYTPIENHDMRPANDGPVIMLGKVSKFGAPLRSGKEGTRNMPKINTGGCVV